MTLLKDDPDAVTPPERRPGELGSRELVRWAWRQLVSMRTALILLLLLALAAIPGSLIPQRGVDSLKTSRWQDAHPTLTPIYEKLGLFSVYNSAWFSAIYLLLMVSLVGCILPRTWVYWQAARARPPAAPRNLGRLPHHTSYTTDQDVESVLERAREVLRKGGYRLAPADGGDAVAAERGYLREAGNLLFHVSVLVVLVGFAVGSMFGYKGGVIVVEGSGFSNTLTQYDDFDPGSLFDPGRMEPFSFTVDSFEADWLYTGPRAGMARKFVAPLTYRESPDSPEKSYDLKVNHPLTVGGTEVFLIGHGYAPIITVRDGNGDVAYTGPTVFLPTNQQTFQSFGVIKASNARPTQIGLDGEFYPTYAYTRATGPYSTFGDALNPGISMTVWTGDLGMDDGESQSVYVLDRSRMTMVKKADGQAFRVDLFPGEQVSLPGGLGSVSFDGYKRWTKIQISRTPGKLVALGGVVLSLLGMLMSLYIRPRRVWVRARAEEGGTLVEVGGLARADGVDLSEVLAAIVFALRGDEESVTRSLGVSRHE